MAGPAERAQLMPTVVRGAGLSVAGFVATQVITLLAYVALARLAPPSTFGAFAAASIIIAGGTLFAESGMTAALIARRGPIEAAAATAAASTFVGGILLSLLGLAVSPLVGLFFKSALIGEVSAVLSGILFFNGASVVPGALLRRQLSLTPRLIAEPLAAIALGVGSGLGLAAGLGVWGLALGAYASAVVRAVSMWVLVASWPRFAGASWALWRELAGYARHIVASEALGQSGAIATTALIGRVLGTAPLGQFRYGWRIMMAGAGITTSGSYILLPAFSQIADDGERFRDAFDRSLRVGALALFPLSFLFLALGEPIAVLLFGDVWRQAGWVLMALSGVVACSPVGSVSAEALKAARRPGFLPKIQSMTVLVPIGLAVAFLPLGPVGVAAGISIGRGIAVAYALTCAASVVGTSFRGALKQLSSPAVAAGIAAVVSIALDRLLVNTAGKSELMGLGLLCLEMLLGGAVYLGAVTALSREAAADIKAIVRVVRPRLRSVREPRLAK